LLRLGGLPEEKRIPLHTLELRCSSMIRRRVLATSWTLRMVEAGRKRSTAMTAQGESLLRTPLLKSR